MLHRDHDYPIQYGTPLNSARKSTDPATHSFLLIKNFSPDTSENRVRDMFASFRSLKDVIIIKNSNNIYVTFDNANEVQRILELSEREGFEDAGRQLKMCLVSKLPLDLNDKSSIVLITIYNEKIEINVDSIFDLFKEFGTIRKIIIFKKKNYQVFIEFGSSDDAFFFKQALHNTNFKGFFFLKIQFTQKKELIVNGDNHYERDFTNDPTHSKHSESLQGYGEPQHSTTPLPSVNKHSSQTEKLSLTEVPKVRKVDMIDNQSTRILTARDNFIPTNSEFNYLNRILSTESGVNPNLRPKEVYPHQNHTYIQPENIITSLKNLDFTTTKAEPSQSETFNCKPIIVESDNISLEKLFSVKLTNLNTDVKHKPIFNLFSLYGNIDHISLDSATSSAIVAYDSETARQAACMFLNGITFFGRPISVMFLKEQLRAEPVTKSYYFNPNQQSPISPLTTTRQDKPNIVHYKINRRLSGDSNSKLKTITKPTHCLYIFNIANLVTIENLKELFENFEPVLKMFYTNEQRISAIFQFQSVETATKILSIFKNFSLLGKNLKINFANEAFMRAPLSTGDFLGEKTFDNGINHQNGPEVIQSKENSRLPELSPRVTSLSGQLSKPAYF